MGATADSIRAQLKAISCDDCCVVVAKELPGLKNRTWGQWCETHDREYRRYV